MYRDGAYGVCSLHREVWQLALRGGGEARPMTGSSDARRWWSAAVLLLLLHSVQATDRPFQRTKRQAKGSEGAAGETPNPFDGAAGRLSLIQKLLKKDLDKMEVAQSLIASKAFKLILDKPNIQRMLLDELPLMRAFDGFRELADNKDASDEEMRAGFIKGMQSAFGFGTDAATKLKDPAFAMNALIKLASSGDENVKLVVSRAKAGDGSAFKELKGMVNAELFPGVDTSVVEAAGRSMSFDKMLANEDVMRFIDMDPQVSKVIRTPKLLTSLEDADAAAATSSSSSSSSP